MAGRCPDIFHLTLCRANRGIGSSRNTSRRCDSLRPISLLGQPARNDHVAYSMEYGNAGPFPRGLVGSRGSGRLFCVVVWFAWNLATDKDKDFLNAICQGL